MQSTKIMLGIILAVLGVFRVCTRAQSTKFMLGIILAVLCSNWVGEVIHSDGIYENDLDADGSVIFLRPSPPPALFAKDAGMVMSRAVWCALRTPEWHGAEAILYSGAFPAAVGVVVTLQPSASADLGWRGAELAPLLQSTHRA